MRRPPPILAAAFVVIAHGFPAAAVPAEQVGQVARLEQLAQYVAIGALCQRFGYAIDETRLSALQEQAVDRATSAGMTETDANEVLNAAVDRQLTIMKSSLDQVSSKLTSTAQDRALVRGFTARYAPRCHDASVDALFGSIVTPPPSPAAALVAFEDGILIETGYASWQTTIIRSRGDLIYAAGVCRAHLSPAQQAALTDPWISVPVGDEAGLVRERTYYAGQFKAGIESAADIDLDGAQCQKILAARRAAMTPKK